MHFPLTTIATLYSIERNMQILESTDFIPLFGRKAIPVLILQLLRGDWRWISGPGASINPRREGILNIIQTYNLKSFSYQWQKRRKKAIHIFAEVAGINFILGIIVILSILIVPVLRRVVNNKCTQIDLHVAHNTSTGCLSLYVCLWGDGELRWWPGKTINMSSCAC